MEYIASVILALMAAGLGAALLSTRKRAARLEEELKELAREREGAPQWEEQAGEIWDRANTVHLYAALSGEESASPSVREKQEEILRLAGEIMERVRPEE